MNPSCRSALSKVAAVILSAALLFPSGPVLAAEIVALGDVGAHIGTLTPAAAPIAIGPVAVGANLLVNPAVSIPTFSPELAGESIASPAALAAAQAQAAVSRHPVINLVNDLQAKGVSLPSRASTRLDGEKALAAAQAMPAGALREKMVAMAHATIATGSNGGASFVGRYDGGSAAFNAAYDGSKAAAGKETSAVAAFARKIPIIGGYLKRKDEKRAVEAAKPIDPTSRELSASQVRWTAPIEQLPASTRDYKGSGRQIVGQDSAQENIRFGLELKEDPQHKGSRFNLYISGPSGSGRETALRAIVTPMAAKMETPTDLVAATNFKDPEEPVILELAPGKAPEFKEAVGNFIENFGMEVMKAQNSPEIVKEKKKIETSVEKGIEKMKAALEAAIADIRLEVPSENNEWGLKIAILQGKMIALPTRRTKGTQDEFQAFSSKEEVEEAIKSGKMTREEFQAAIKAAQDEGKKLKDDYQKVEAQSAMAKMQAQVAVEMLNRQAAVAAAQEAAQEILPIVADVNRHHTPEHDAWAATAKKRVEAFNAEVAKQVVDAKSGMYGFILNEQSLAEGMIGITKLKNGKMVPVQDIQAEGLTQEDLEAIVKAATPFIEKLRLLTENIDREHQKLHENDPKYEAKAVQYVQTMLTVAANNYQLFMPHDHENTKGKPHFEPEEVFRINVMQTSEAGSGAPVVWEHNPTYARLFGAAEGGKKRMMIDGMAQIAKMPGGPVLEPGAYIKARGGFLVLDVMQVLREPGVWPALMQAVRNGEAEVAEEGLMGLYSNGDKYHIPGKTKIVFIGSPYIKMLLEHYDEDFAAGFQAPVAEFERKLEISQQSIEGYLDFMKNVIAKAKGLIREFEKDGIAAILESSARDMDSNKKLSAQFGLSDIRMRKASQAAADRLKADPKGPQGVTRQDVEKVRSLDLQSDSLHAKSYQEILRDNIFILDNMGEPIVGQINGLAVMGAFGAPMRKTFVASAGGSGIEVVSEDRNIGTTGPSYNKAIEVINGFVNTVFPSKKPWSVKIRISAEQNYGGIDGDSATSTQLYGVLSALSGIGIKPTMAVTGSMDQFGHVQAIGGVNEKIEGFFDLCKMRGLTGTQGVMIPKSNVADLMLKPEVVEAIKAGQFHIYAVDNVKDGWEIMTGTSYELAKAKALEKLKSFRR